MSSQLIGLALVVALAAYFVVRAFVATTVSVPSGSMSPALVRGDRILVDRLTQHLRGIDRGDVVVFDASEAFGVDRRFVKRVIGVGGDRVACCDKRGRLTVNGRPVDERAYLYKGDKASELRFDIRVPEGRLWVMGDHRSESLDSRARLGAPGGGTVAQDDLVGRVVARVWPVARIGVVS